MPNDNSKDLLKEQLKKQTSGSTSTKPLPTTGRIYFFQRLKDNFIFPVDTEIAASHIFRRKDFKYTYRYIGWSSGKHLDEFNRKPQTVMKLTDSAELTADSRVEVNERMVEYHIVLEKELDEAIDNLDKSIPRDFRKLDLNGNMMDNKVAPWIQ